jgi:hypothetical protein
MGLKVFSQKPRRWRLREKATPHRPGTLQKHFHQVTAYPISITHVIRVPVRHGSNDQELKMQTVRLWQYLAGDQETDKQRNGTQACAAESEFVP